MGSTTYTLAACLTALYFLTVTDLADSFVKSTLTE